MDDVISRSAAIDTVHRMREIWDTGDIDDLEEMIVTALAELCPPQRTGKWIPWRPDRIGFAEEFYCSKCGHVVQLSYVTRTCDYDFCPHCGAYMVTEEEM